MKLNNKGFAITTIIYGTLVVFLLLLASLLGMLSTHKVRLEKLKVKTEEIIDSREAICKVTVTPSGTSIDGNYYPTIEMSISSSKEDVTYSFDGTTYNTENTKKISGNVSTLQYNLSIKDESDKEMSCGTVKLIKRTEYRQIQYSDTEYSWSQSSYQYAVPNSSCSGNISKSEAEATGKTSYQTCTSLETTECIWEGISDGMCSTKITYSGTCSPTGTVVKYDSWKSTSQTGDCYNSVERRYTYKVEA